MQNCTTRITARCVTQLCKAQG